MKRRWHVLLPVAGLVFQIVPILFVNAVAVMSYRGHRIIPEAFERPVSLLGLACFAGICFFCSSVGAYGLLTRSRLAVAVPMIAVCCVPAAIGGAVYLYVLLVFLTLA